MTIPVSLRPTPKIPSRILRQHRLDLCVAHARLLQHRRDRPCEAHRPAAGCDHLKHRRRQHVAFPAPDAVVADHHLVSAPFLQQLHERLHAHAVGLDDLEAEAVEADIGAAVDDLHVIVVIGIAAGMSDDDFVRGDAEAREKCELFVAHHRVGVRRDRCAGGERGFGAGAEDRLLVIGERRHGGRELDDARLDAGVADAFGQLLDEEVREFRFRVGIVLEFVAPIGGAAQMMVIEPGREDDVEARAARDFRHQIHVAADVVGAGIEQRREARRFQFADAVETDGRHLAEALARRGRVAVPAGKADHQMLVHQRLAEAIGVDGTSGGVDLHGGFSPLGPRLRGDDTFILSRALFGAALDDERSRVGGGGKDGTEGELLLASWN